MSSLAIPSAVSAALPAINVKPHGGHGHKKGSEMDASLDSTSSSSTAAQGPVGAAQSLFGNALNALEQLVGVQPPSAASLAAAPGSSAAPTNANANANSTAASIAAAGSKINLFA
jgi:hypothetical protein